jgi:hypothetical protein
MICCTTGNADIEIYKGEDRTITITVRNSSGARVDITGAVLYFTVRISPFAAVSSIALNSTLQPAQFTILDQTNATTKGDYQVKLLPANTRDLPASDSYVWDSWIVLGGEQQPVIADAKFTLKQPVTVL